MSIIKEKISLSVIIPCFNEVDTIEQVIKIVFDVDIDDIEIIVVDDGSVDGTKEKLTNLSKEKNIINLSHTKNLGKGAAIKTALEKVTKEIVIIQDADLEYNPNDYHNLYFLF